MESWDISVRSAAMASRVLADVTHIESFLIEKLGTFGHIP